MSLIHEALEKLGQEKGAKEKKIIPGTESAEPVTPSEGPGPTAAKAPESDPARSLYWLGGALTLFFIVGIVYWIGNSLQKGPREGGQSPSLTPVAREHGSFPHHSSQGRFSLTGITEAGGDYSAIVNNQLVRVGDRVSGAEVQSITDREVRLEDRGQTVTLSLY